MSVHPKIQIGKCKTKHQLCRERFSVERNVQNIGALRHFNIDRLHCAYDASI